MFIIEKSKPLVKPTKRAISEVVEMDNFYVNTCEMFNMSIDEDGKISLLSETDDEIDPEKVDDEIEDIEDDISDNDYESDYTL